MDSFVRVCSSISVVSLILSSVTTPFLVRFAPSLMHIATLAKVRLMFTVPSSKLPMP